MNRRLRRLAGALVAAFAAGGLLIGVAQALTPPAGTPDLAQMTLQPSDLAPGALTAGSYAKPPQNFVAQYNRTYNGAATTDGVALDAVEAQILLAKSVASATRSFRLLRIVYGSKLGRQLIAAAIAKGAHQAFTAKDIRFGKLTAIAVGAQSLLEPVFLTNARTTLAADFLVLRVDRVLLNLTVLVRRPTLARSVMTALASAVATHITTVLAATGPSGPSGPTAATGATG